MEESIHPVAKWFGVLLAILVGIFALWCTWVAFTGGTLPLLNWTIDGGIWTGLLWLLIIDPIVIAAGYWVGRWLYGPVSKVFTRAE